MKKEVENKKSFIRVPSFSGSSGDESEKAKPKIDKEELREYLQNSDEEDSSKNFSQKVKKNLSRKEKLLITIPTFMINKLNPIKKIHPQNISYKVTISKNFRKRRKNLELHLLIIPKEKIINTSLNMITKRFTSVLSTLKIT